MNEEYAKKWLKRHKRLTMPQLHKIVGFYHSKFPEWKIAHKDTIVREDSPILQGITIERLSGGDYRLTGHIRVLVGPEDCWSFELPQNLNIKFRHIRRRQDTLEFREQVVHAIHEEFRPSVDRPLVASSVLELYEREACPTSAEAYSLAPFNAYMGKDERALFWCRQFSELVKKERGGNWCDYDRNRLSFLQQLELWIKSGEARVQLESVLQHERQKWGLT